MCILIVLSEKEIIKHNLWLNYRYLIIKQCVSDKVTSCYSLDLGFFKVGEQEGEVGGRGKRDVEVGEREKWKLVEGGKEMWKLVEVERWKLVEGGVRS